MELARHTVPQKLNLRLKNPTWDRIAGGRLPWPYLAARLNLGQVLWRRDHPDSRPTNSASHPTPFQPIPTTLSRKRLPVQA